MNCALSRELISAGLDGEASPEERSLLAAHLDGCAACRRYAMSARAAHRVWRVRPAPDVPDLTHAILSRADHTGTVPAGTGRGVAAIRWALVGLALAQLVLAGPELVEHADFNDELHALHHLNAWALAFAVGLAVVAWQPWRVRGLLPLASALGALMGFTVVLDVVNHHVIPMPAAEHVIELAGLLLLWILARATAPADGHGGLRAAWPRPSSAPASRAGEAA